MATLGFLCVGTPTPAATGFGSAMLLSVGDERILVDCGPATTYKLSRLGLLPTAVAALFFTHHHSDHNADYPCFLMTRWDLERDANDPLQVWGPPPTRLITERLVGPDGAFRDNFVARTTAPMSQATHRDRGGALPRHQPAPMVVDVDPGPIATGPGWQASGVEVQHAQPYLTSLAYRFDLADGSICFAGDTGSVTTVGEFAADCHDLVVSCWEFRPLDGVDTSAVMARFTDAARMATIARAKRLFITHTGSRLGQTDPPSRTEARAEIGALFAGEVVFAEELMQVELFTNQRPG